MGAAIGNGLLAVATDLSAMLFGLLALVTVIGGLIIISGIGGQGLQKPVRQYLLAVVMGALFTGGFNRIATFVQTTFRLG